MESPRITTPRLVLRPATVELLTAELHSREALAEGLDARLPDDWPPEHWDEGPQRYCLDALIQQADAVGWMNWYVLDRSDAAPQPLAVGTAGFAGLPDGGGTVMLGYSVVPSKQHLGYATEAVAGLLNWAFSHPEVQCIAAETFPHLVASIRVLEKNGFDRAGLSSEEGSVRFELQRRKR